MHGKSWNFIRPKENGPEKQASFIYYFPFNFFLPLREINCEVLD